MRARRWLLLFLALMISGCFGDGKIIHLNDPDGVTPPPERVRLDPTRFSHHFDISLDTRDNGAYITRQVRDFPLLIRLDSSNFDFDSADASGRDIRFADSEGYMLDHAIETWRATEKSAVVWVRINIIEPDTSNQFFTMYFGSDNPDALPSPGPVFSSENGFAATWHLSDDALNLTDGYKDATPNGRDATAVNLRPDTSSVPGVISGAVSLHGASYLSAKTLMEEEETFTLSAWLKPRSTEGTVLSIGDSVLLLAGVQTGPAGLYHGNTGWYLTESDTALDDGWHHLAYVTAPTQSRQQLFIDGELVREHNINTPIVYDIGYEETTIGVHAGKDRFYLDADIDEIRISSVARSKSWLKLSFENQRLDSSGWVLF